MPSAAVPAFPSLWFSATRCILLRNRYCLALNLLCFGNIISIRHVLYCCSASRPATEGETIEESKSVKTEKLSLKASALPNVLVKSKTCESTDQTTYDNWFNAVYTVATDSCDKNEMTLMAQSHGEAIIVLDETPYFDSLKKAMQIRKYVMQHNVPQMPRSTQDIIRAQQDQANNYETLSIEALRKAIENAQFYVDGEHLSLKSGDAKSKIEQSLEYLVAHVYSELDLVTKNADTDDDIIEILSRKTQLAFDGHVPNQNAAAKIEEYLEMQDIKSLPTSMADIQTRYQAIPYGWREIDIAAVVALLIVDQKVTVKYAGNTIQPSDPKLPDMLRKKSEIGRTLISKRKNINASNMKEAREFLRDFLDIMDVPADEDGLVSFIIDKFTAMKTHYEDLQGRYLLDYQ